MDKNIKLGPECDVAISSRVRLARNIEGIPFPSRINADGRRAVVKKAADALCGQPEIKAVGFDGLSGLEAHSYMERRIVSPDFLGAGEGKELFADAGRSLYIMVNEEDHLRIQSLSPGLSLEEAYETAAWADELIGSGLTYAFDEKLGYLTHCLTNLGTGLRSSAMLHLPAASRAGYIGRVAGDLAKVGLTMRGMYGEASEAGGCLYQISNQVTLGVSESQTIEKLKICLDRIISIERSARDDLIKSDKNRVADSIRRAYGILSNACLMGTSEFLRLYSDLRLGVTYGMVKELSYPILDRLLVETMPASLLALTGSKESDGIDAIRAKYIKSQISEEK